MRYFVSVLIVSVLVIPAYAVPINPNTMVNQYTPDAQTVALYHFESSAKWADSTGNGFDMTNDSGASYIPGGRFGDGLDLLGASDSHLRYT